MPEDPDCLLIDPLYCSDFSSLICHPDCPNGAGGPGRFRSASVLGMECVRVSSLPHPVSPAARQLTLLQIEKEAKNAKGIDLTKLPAVMDANGWHKGASLMRSWFKRPVKIAPNYDAPDISTITMDWLLGFDRAAKVYTDLVKEKIWQNEPARKEIAKMLLNKGLLNRNQCFSMPFGNLALSADQLDADYINQRAVKMSSDLDDLNAALANFVFNIVVAGNISSDDKSTSGFIVKINNVGIYAKDSYDFEGKQFLGYWDTTENSVSMWKAFSGTAVHNEDFSRWRSTNGKGGDFRVFSDVKVLPQQPPVVFRIP